MAHQALRGDPFALDVDLTPTHVNYTVGAGDSQQLTWTFPASVDPAEFTAEIGGVEITPTGPTSTKIRLTLTAADAADVVSGRWFLRHISGDERRTWRGRWTVL